MCGRYVSFLPPAEIARLFRTVNPVPNIAPSWNLAPSQEALVVRLNPNTGERHLDVLRWGFLPYWAKTEKSTRRPINARAEALATSPMFRDAYARHRALVPAGAFFEWRKSGPGTPKQPFALAHADGKPMAFAGLWSGWRGPDDAIERTFAIVTTAANQDVAELHDRMPVIVEQADWPLWLGEVEGDPAALLYPPPTGTLRAWPVSTRVNDPKNNGADLLERAETTTG